MGGREDRDRTNKPFFFSPPTTAHETAGKSSQTNYFVSPTNGTDDEEKLSMCMLISSCSVGNASLTLSVCPFSSHQCAHIKSGSAEKAARQLDTEHFVWVQVSAVRTRFY